MKLKDVELAFVVGGQVFPFVEKLEEYDLSNPVARATIMDDIQIELRRIEEYEVGQS